MKACTNMKCLPNNGDEGGRLGSILKGIHEGVQGNVCTSKEGGLYNVGQYTFSK